MSSGVLSGSSRLLIPPIFDRSPEHAKKRFIEFFVVTIRNRNTREAYYRACCRFFSWCEHNQISDPRAIEPIHVAAYIEFMGRDFEKPTVKQHLAAVRTLFDWLVTGHAIAVNPATSVRGPKHSTIRGTTPALLPTEARQILNCIDASTIVGLRDRALIALMIFSFARISAALSMRVEDYYFVGNRRWIRLREKGGLRHEMPAHRDLERFINSYIDGAHLMHEIKDPLFRPAVTHDKLSSRPMSRVDAYRMVRRRADEAGLAGDICCHSFRATGITTYLNNGGTLENAQRMAAHKSPRTTKLYDRTDDRITEEEVERIVI